MISKSRKNAKCKDVEEVCHEGDLLSTTMHDGSSGVSSEVASVDSLLEQARSTVDPLVAVAWYQEALRVDPDNTSIMGDAAGLMLQLGQTSAAQQLLMRSIEIAPGEGPEKYLYLAQLHEGHEALGFYEEALKLLQQLESKSAQSKEETAAIKQKICMAHCSVGELFLTDLCFEMDAEQRCQDALDKSMLYDYGGPEPLHTLANLRLSQRNLEGAIGAAEEAFKRLEHCDPPCEHEFRVSLAKVLIECSDSESGCCDKALQILSGLMQEDDENVEVWYLMGVAFNRLRPPDYESARDHLKTAADMLEKIRKRQEEVGETFDFQEQVRLVREQMKESALLAKSEGDPNAEDGGESLASSTSNLTNVELEGAMNCG